MSRFEEEYKKRFQEEQPAANLDSEVLWSKVSGELNSNAGGASIWQNRKFLFGFIGILLVSGIFYWGHSELSMTERTYEPRVSGLHSNEGNALLGEPDQQLNKEWALLKADLEESITTEFEGVPDESPKSLKPESRGKTEVDIDQTEEHGPGLLIATDQQEKVSNTKGQTDIRSNLDFLKVESSTNVEVSGMGQNPSDEQQHSRGSHISGAVRKGTETAANSVFNPSLEEKTNPLEQANTLTNNPENPIMTNDELELEANDDSTSELATDGLNEGSQEISRQSLEETHQDFEIQNESNSLQSLPLILYSFKREVNRSLLPNEKEIKKDAYYGDKSLRPSELSFLAGGVLLKNTYHAADSPSELMARDQLSSTFKQDWGYSASIRATWKTKNIIQLSTGLDIDQWRSVYDNVTSSEVSVLEEGRIIALTTNNQGEVIPVFGSLEYNAVTTRTVLHHNTYRMVTIPLEVGLEKRINQLSFGLSLGAGYSSFISQNGRSLNEAGELTFFDVGDEKLPFKKSNFSYHSRAWLGYRFKEKIELRVEPSLRYFTRSESPLHDLPISSSAFSLKMGISYLLHW